MGEYDKLVTADPEDFFTLQEVFIEPPGNLGDKIVTECVSHRVVYQLDVVHIEGEERLACAGIKREKFGKSFGQFSPV
ncbi:MAG: hypothetical protein BWY20_01386 [Spirochaetes bacterium ADurb.Bin215]|nr:MAG: hypothetical protein BWY20_01386 [Spirochaetes bacterium ADurb.Bin215]